MNHPIGAKVMLHWADDSRLSKDFPESFERYFSFGQHDDEAEDEFDEFGVPDTDIFFYAFEGEEQLQKMQTNPEPDFIVVSWVLVYDKYSVWVGGAEINEYSLTFDEAEALAEQFIEDGYDDVKVERWTS